MPKQSKSDEQLNRSIQILLRVGQLLLANGAECERIHDSLWILSRSLGFSEILTTVSYRSILITLGDGAHFRTKLISVPNIAVNLRVLCKVSDLIYAAKKHNYTLEELCAELRKLENGRLSYPKYAVALGVGLACACISILFGGKGLSFCFAGIAATLGMSVRTILALRHTNPIIATFLVALLAPSICFTLNEFFPTPQVITSASASVLFLVPGVPLITGVQDVFKGHASMGVARMTSAAMIFLAIGLGLLISASVAGLGRLSILID